MIHTYLWPVGRCARKVDDMPWPAGERELERQAGRVAAHCEGISADDDGGNRGKVVPRVCVAVASVLRRRITGGERAPWDSVASRYTMFPFASASG